MRTGLDEAWVGASDVKLPGADKGGEALKDTVGLPKLGDTYYANRSGLVYGQTGDDLGINVGDSFTVVNVEPVSRYGNAFQLPGALRVNIQRVVDGVSSTIGSNIVLSIDELQSIPLDRRVGQPLTAVSPRVPELIESCALRRSDTKEQVATVVRAAFAHRK